jgi:sugar phosphate permease
MAATAPPCRSPGDAARRYRWLIFGLLALGYILVYFHRLCPAVLALDLMRDLQAGGSLTGLLAAAYFYPYALMQLPAGLLADSWGARKTITLFFLVAAAGALMLALSPSIAWAIAGRTVVGVGAAMLFVPTLKILSEWFRRREFAFMTGLLLAVGGVGSLTAASPLVWLSASLGWRNAFHLVGAFTALSALLVWRFVRDRPAQMGWAALPVPPGETAAPAGLARGVGRVLRCPHFWPLALWFFFDFGVFFAFAGLWGGPWLVQVYGLSRAESGRVLSMIAAGLVIGAPALSWLSDRVLQRRKPVLVLTSGVIVLLTGLLAFHTAGLPRGFLYLLFFLVSACGNAVGAVAFTMNKELFPIGLAGTATGLVNLFCFAGGAVFQPLLGAILERGGRLGEGFRLEGYRAAFMVLLGAAVLALLSALATRETMGGPRRPPGGPAKRAEAR